MNNSQKSSRNIIKKSCRNDVTKDQNSTAEKKQNVRWKGTVKLTMQFIDVAYQDNCRKRVFLRLAEGEWKSRFLNTSCHLNTKRYSKKATLPSYIWHLKSVSSEKHNLKWSVFRCVIIILKYLEKCLLCLYEKLEIVTNENQKELLNSRSELLCKCRHPSNFLLKNYTGNDFR